MSDYEYEYEEDDDDEGNTTSMLAEAECYGYGTPDGISILKRIVDGAEIDDVVVKALLKLVASSALPPHENVHYYWLLLSHRWDEHDLVRDAACSLYQRLDLLGEKSEPSLWPSPYKVMRSAHADWDTSPLLGHLLYTYRESQNSTEEIIAPFVVWYAALLVLEIVLMRNVTGHTSELLNHSESGVQHITTNIALWRELVRGSGKTHLSDPQVFYTRYCVSMYLDGMQVGDVGKLTPKDLLKHGSHCLLERRRLVDLIADSCREQQHSAEGMSEHDTVRGSAIKVFVLQLHAVDICFVNQRFDKAWSVLMNLFPQLLNLLKQREAFATLSYARYIALELVSPREIDPRFIAPEVTNVIEASIRAHSELAAMVESRFDPMNPLFPRVVNECLMQAVTRKELKTQHANDEARELAALEVALINRIRSAFIQRLQMAAQIPTKDMPHEIGSAAEHDIAAEADSE